MILKSEAKYEGKSAEQLLSEIISRTSVPVQRSMSN
jgi:MoxR-like ATPase